MSVVDPDPGIARAVCAAGGRDPTEDEWAQMQAQVDQIHAEIRAQCDTFSSVRFRLPAA